MTTKPKIKLEDLLDLIDSTDELLNQKPKDELEYWTDRTIATIERIQLILNEKNVMAKEKWNLRLAPVPENKRLKHVSTQFR